MPDLVLVSPRHLFRMPYSLHEKTALASVVLSPKEVDEFEMKDADPMNAEIKNFMPNSKEGEASELLMQALDWSKEHREKSSEKADGKFANFKQIKLENISEENFPPCVKNILNGISDGKKRALFILISLFRSIGMDKEELEKRIYEWNKKNETPMKEGYIQAQLSWAYKRKPIMPPNCKEFYQGIGVCQPDSYCLRIKNPVNYTIGKNLQSNKKSNKFKNKK
jgi:DNA primase large subunit